jgi:hypothetical protein
MHAMTECMCSVNDVCAFVCIDISFLLPASASTIICIYRCLRFHTRPRLPLVISLLSASAVCLRSQHMNPSMPDCGQEPETERMGEVRHTHREDGQAHTQTHAHPLWMGVCLWQAHAHPLWMGEVRHTHTQNPDVHTHAADTDTEKEKQAGEAEREREKQRGREGGRERRRKRERRIHAHTTDSRATPRPAAGQG